MSELLVGIDIGTTMTKAAVVSADGKELSWGRARTPWHEVLTGAEADPSDIFDAALEAVAGALAAAPAGQVIGAGVTSMAETAVLLGADGQPLWPCIVWHDTRGEDEATDLARVFGVQELVRRTGLNPSPMRTLVKLAWLDRHGGPKPVRALSVADWVVHRLGGDQVAEASLACRTGALSLAGRSWWEEALEWAGAGANLFPPVVQAGTLVGRLSQGGWRRNGGDDPGDLERLAGAALAPAGHDHLCAAAGVDATRAEQVLDSCGTAEALVRTVAPLTENELGRAVASGLETSWHTVPGHQALLAGHALGLVLERVLSLVGATGPEAASALDAVAANVGPGSLRVVLDSPYGGPSIAGLGSGTSPAALWSAVLDAVAAWAAQTMSAMDTIAGPAAELVLSGGWARSDGLRRRKLGLLPRVRWPKVTEAGARGAALFGGMAAGLFSEPADFPRPPERLS